jgi:succinate dehydrogenase hydrophobic anchor subunit
LSDRLGEWMTSVMVATAIALLVLLPVEIVGWLIASDPTSHTTEWVADRWSSATWRAVDWVFLVIALTHGGLGAVRWLGTGQTVGGGRTLGAVVIATACFAVMVLASYTLFSFELS